MTVGWNSSITRRTAAIGSWAQQIQESGLVANSACCGSHQCQPQGQRGHVDPLGIWRNQEHSHDSAPFENIVTTGAWSEGFSPFLS